MKLRKSRLAKIVELFQGKRVGVVGDLVADVYIHTQSARVSREAPVLILQYEYEELRPGGAANCLNNFASLKAEPVAFGIVGDDSRGHILLDTLKQSGVDTKSVKTVAGFATPTKTRILAANLHTVYQQVVRLDQLAPNSSPSSILTELAAEIGKRAKEFDALIISDYQLGVLEGEVYEKVRGFLKSKNLKVFVDSRFRLFRFPNAFAYTPNEEEAQETVGFKLGNNGEIVKAAQILKHKLKAKCLLITLGRKGMYLFYRGRGYFIDIYGTDQVADVTGAGDTVMATFALAIMSGAHPYEAAYIANIAAGIVVTKAKTATVSLEELLDAIKGL